MHETNVIKMEMCIKKLDSRVKIPRCSTLDSAGIDIFALEDVIVPKDGSVCVVRTGIAIECRTDLDIFIGLYIRSGLSKKGIHLSNGVGVIDKDYRGEIQALVYNTSGTDYKIESGDKFAQLIVQDYHRVKLVEVEKLSSTDRGSGGFGSTGNK